MLNKEKFKSTSKERSRSQNNDTLELLLHVNIWYKRSSEQCLRIFAGELLSTFMFFLLKFDEKILKVS